MDEPKSFQLADVKRLLSTTWNEWNTDNATRLGAALAYYTVLSVAPLLIVAITIAGFLLGEEAARGQIYEQIYGLVGSQGAEAIQTLIQGASRETTGLIASLLGFLALLWGASSVTGELRSSLNLIWNVPTKGDEGIRGIIKEKSYAMVAVLGCGFLLLVSLIVSAALAAAEKFISQMLPLPPALLEGMNSIVSLAIITGIFALLFKLLPDIEVRWSDVLLGSLVTAILFTAGKFLIGMYLGKASFGSTYGAAGSLVIVLVWVYYSAQIFFLGAEFTQVYAREFGSNPNTITPKVPSAQARLEGKTSVPLPFSAATGSVLLLPASPHEHTLLHNIAAIFGALAGFGKGVAETFRDRKRESVPKRRREAL